jgi:hypothetical protein
MSDREQCVDDVRSAGLIRRRLLDGYRLTRRGNRYLRNAILRDEDLRAQMSKQTDRWESGTMTKAERREALVELVLLAWTRDRIGTPEAIADLRSQGLDDPLKLRPRRLIP